MHYASYTSHLSNLSAKASVAPLAVLTLIPVLSLFAMPALAGTTAATALDAPTFSEDVAPIFFNHCATCHRPDQVAPMSLLSYKEARPWARSIARQVANRDMPPWSGDSDKHTWSNDISLSDQQIATVVQWVEAGAPEGDPAALPKAPSFPDAWTLGEPDLILTLDAVEIPADGEDLFPKQVLKLDGLDRTRWVRAIEFLPSDRRAAHHFLTTYSTPSGGERVAGQGTGQSLEGRGGSGIFGVWTAGMPPYAFPEGMGRILSPTSQINADLHYHPFGEATVDQTRIGIYFGEGELQKEVATLFGSNTGIRIPAGANNHLETAFHIFDRDMQVLAFSPHMHVRGKAMSYELTYPDGSKETLLDVPKYDYNWQWLYYPNQLIDIPKGSRLDITAAWDNSEDNVANPDASQEIIYRGDTFNEMFVGFFEAIPKDGTYHEAPKPETRITNLLSAHDPAHSYSVGGFLPFGFYAPKEGEGWLYLASGVAMFTISLDDFEWTGNKLRIVAQFPTVEASATETIIEGTLNDKGELVGTFHYAIDSPRPLKLPLLAKPLAANAVASAGGGAVAEQ